MFYLQLKVRHVEYLILLLLPLVGDLDGHLWYLDVDEQLVPLSSLLHLLHIILWQQLNSNVSPLQQ